MKKHVVLCMLILMAIGCEDGHKLTFDRLEITGDVCTDCPQVEIDVPHALDETTTGKRINTAIQEELIYTLKFDEAHDVDTVEGAITSFTDSYLELKEKFNEEAIGWEASIKGDVVYEDENMVTIALNSYTFTGGAHGYGAAIFLNFDKRTGDELEQWQLFDDQEGFEKFAEAKFRIQEKIPQDENINVTGFMFSGDRFHLPENLGYTENGIALRYNQYEVASYADGPIILTLPYNEVNKYLKRKVEL